MAARYLSDSSEETLFQQQFRLKFQTAVLRSRGASAAKFTPCFRSTVLLVTASACKDPLKLEQFNFQADGTSAVKHHTISFALAAVRLQAP